MNCSATWRYLSTIDSIRVYGTAKDDPHPKRRYVLDSKTSGEDGRSITTVALEERDVVQDVYEG